MMVDYKMNREMMMGAVEEVIFSEGNLEELKESITDLQEGMIEAKDLRVRILDSRVHIFREIEDLIKLFMKKLENETAITEFSSKKGDVPEDIMEMMKQKDELLMELARGLGRIHEKLRKKSDKGELIENLDYMARERKVKDILEDAADALTKNRNEEYIRLRFLALEKIAIILHEKVFKKSLERGNNGTIDDLLGEIEKELRIKIVNSEKLVHFRRLRNKIVHNHVKISDEQVKEAKDFIENLHGKLKERFNKKILGGLLDS